MVKYSRGATANIDDVVKRMNIQQTRGGQYLGAIENAKTGTVHAIINPQLATYYGNGTGIELQCCSVIANLKEYGTTTGLHTRPKYRVCSSPFAVNCKSCLKRKISLNNGQTTTIKRELYVLQRGLVYETPADPINDVVLVMHGEVECRASGVEGVLEYLNEFGHHPTEIIENFKDGTFGIFSLTELQVRVKTETKIIGLEVKE